MASRNSRCIHNGFRHGGIMRLFFGKIIKKPPISLPLALSYNVGHFLFPIVDVNEMDQCNNRLKLNSLLYMTETLPHSENYLLKRRLHQSILVEPNFVATTGF